ncbi:MAG TPA: TonB family protein [Candidatus Acidoferrales bacterium]|nr:TonB family protein [Candidatus Acidoferrales bacterium]
MNTTINTFRQSSLTKGVSAGPKSVRVVLPPKTGRPSTTARFELLPSGKSRWSSLGVSATCQALFLLTVVIIPLAFPQKLIPKMMYDVVTIAAPVTEVPLPPEPPKQPIIKPKPKPTPPPPVVEAAVIPEPVRQPKLLAPKVVAPKVQPKKVMPADIPKLDTPIDTPKVDLKVNTPGPVRPRPVVTGMIDTGSAAPATLPKSTPIDKVQTGGFGDPNGMAGPANPNKGGNINARGQLDLPNGPGYGNGTGGANGARGTVASAGFGNGTAIAPSGGGGGRGTVRQGVISQAVIESDKPKQQQSQAAAVQPIEILDKPRPEYTAEARALKLEGDVIISVVFKVNGEIQILGVVKGMGHGLDENAIRAAQKIKYKPAISNGQPVDFPARVHIEFQLAY